MNIFVVPNLNKDNIKEAAEKVVNLLLQDGHNVYLHNTTKNEISVGDTPYATEQEAVLLCDLVITLGGDGTIIRHSSYSLENEIPILGINLGRIGFLAQLEMENLEKLHLLKEGLPNVEERAVISVSYIDSNGTKQIYPAINEIVLSLRHITRLIELNLDVNGKYFEHYRADGIIFATPSGSSGYSLSAGGTVLDIHLEAIAITPICPYSYQKSCICLSGDCVIGIKAPDETFFAVDGAKSFSVKKDDYVEVKQYNKKLKLVNFSNANYYETLSDKLRKRG